MPLITTPKAGSANSNTPSKVITRQEVPMGRPSASSARVQALKDKLTGKPPTQPVAPRQARTSSRQEEMAKLNKFTTSPQNVVNKSQLQAKTSARGGQVDFSGMELPPSGLAPGQEAPTPPHNTVERTQPAVEEPNEQLSPQQVALAREAQRLRKARQEFKAEQEVWKQEQAKYVPKERLSSETLKVLSEAGITPDKLVELQTAQAETADPNQPLYDKISQLEKMVTDLTDPENGTLAKRDQEAYDQAKSQIRSDATLLVDSNPTFETIRSEGKTEDVVELVTRVFEEEGIILDVEEAASLVEDKLVQNLSTQFEKLSKYEKIKAKLGKQSESTAEATSPQQTTSLQPKPTLTNAGSKQGQLTPRERAILRVQENMNALKGNR